MKPHDEDEGKVERQQAALRAASLETGGAITALADLATMVLAPELLERGGSMAQARKLARQSGGAAEATEWAARTGKGYFAEAHHAATFNAAAGARGSSVVAHINPNARDPRHDLVIEGSPQLEGVQVKMGTEQYVRRSAAIHEYGTIVAASEVAGPLAESGLPTCDRVAVDGISSRPLSNAEASSTTRDLIQRELDQPGFRPVLDTLVGSAKAGLRDGLAAFSVHVAAELASALYEDRRPDVPEIIRRAIPNACVAGATSALQTSFLLSDFLSQAGPGIADRVVHQVARGALVAGAVANVVVRTAMDFFAFKRGEFTRDELLARFGVHVVTAATGVAVVYVTLRLCQRLPWWATGVVLLGAGFAAHQLGRGLGEMLFFPQVAAKSDATWQTLLARA